MTGSALEIDRISKRFETVVACDEMAFAVREGELFGFVGSNGAGKTTAMRIILGVLSPDSGSVRWNGEPIDFELRRQIGYMPEERGVYPKMKVGEQLGYFARLHGLNPHDAAQSVGRWLERLGISERVDDEVQKLSLGNQQRVQLASALVHDPKVLVLDEPFSGLDPVAVDVMSEVLREKAAQGTAVIFSSHQLDLVQRLCDRVGIVRRGRIVACDSVEALRSRGARQIVIDAPHAGAGWASRIDGVTVVDETPQRTVLELQEHVDDQLVLHAAIRTGPVHEFAQRRPSLAELFRDVVSEKDVSEKDGVTN